MHCDSRIFHPLKIPLKIPRQVARPDAAAGGWLAPLRTLSIVLFPALRARNRSSAEARAYPCPPVPHFFKSSIVRRSLSSCATVK
jgi:hypothetical protein